MVKIKNIRKIDLALITILAAAGIARYWALNFGLPDLWCRPDENQIVGIITSPLRFFHPGRFNYPSLYKYIVLCLYGLYYLFVLIADRYISMADFIKRFLLDPAPFYLIARSLTAFLGTMTVFIVYKISKSLFDRRTALISSLFMSLAYLHVRDSHFGVADVPMTFFIMCAMLFLVNSYNRKDLKNYILAGIFAGLATSTKYAGILLVVPMCIVHILNIANKKDLKVTAFLDRRMLFFLITMAGAFLLGTPFALLDFYKFVSDLLFESGYLNYGHGIVLGRGWAYHLWFSLFFGLGGSLWFASLLGIVVLAKTDVRKASVLCSFPLVYYIFMGKGYNVLLRYSIPIIPFLCITAAVFIIFLSNRLAAGFKHRTNSIITYSLAILIILPSAYNVMRFDRLLGEKDNRLVAAEWINENLAEDSSIYVAGFIYGKPRLFPTVEALEREDREIIEKILTENKERGTDEKNIKRFRLIKSYREGNALPQYIITEESPLIVYSQIPETIKNLLKDSYHLKKSFEAIKVNNKENLFDQQDAFYIPFVGFQDIQRPGPNLYIYEKN